MKSASDFCIIPIVVIKVIEVIMEREVKIRKNKEFRQKMRELRRKRPLSKRAEFDNTQIASWMF